MGTWSNQMIFRIEQQRIQAAAEAENFEHNSSRSARNWRRREYRCEVAIDWLIDRTSTSVNIAYRDYRRPRTEVDLDRADLKNYDLTQRVKQLEAQVHVDSWGLTAADHLNAMYENEVANVVTLKERLATANSDLDDLTKSLKETYERMESNERVLTDSLRENKRYEAQLAGHRAEIKVTSAKLTRAYNEIDNLKARLTESAQDHALTQTKLTDAIAHANALQKELDNGTVKELERVREILNRTYAEVDHMKSEIDNLEQESAEKDRKIRSLEADHIKLNNIYSSILEGRDNLQGEVKALNDALNDALEHRKCCSYQNCPRHD